MMIPATTPMQSQLDFLLAYIGIVLIIFVLIRIAEILDKLVVRLWLSCGWGGSK